MSTKSFQPGDAYGVSRTITGSTGALVNADSTPTAQMWRNGIYDSTVTVTVANPSTGCYSLSATIPGTYATGDRVAVLLLATVGGIATGPSSTTSVLSDTPTMPCPMPPPRRPAES
jgi:hypothetical protein